jgi:hypothetical protein
MAANSKDRQEKVPEWQHYYNTTTEIVEDNVTILVAALGVIY